MVAFYIVGQDTSRPCGRLPYDFRLSMWTFTIRVPAVRVDIYGTGSGFSVVGILGTGGRKGEISGHPGQGVSHGQVLSISFTNFCLCPGGRR